MGGRGGVKGGGRVLIFTLNTNLSKGKGMLRDMERR